MKLTEAEMERRRELTRERMIKAKEKAKMIEEKYGHLKLSPELLPAKMYYNRPISR